ncbi:MAG: RNA polymerase sigma factor [Gracilibacteraceae bacterium]|nr:RNA polymerase sigma factor [Gracilibacteraceae bacterium]
MADFDQIYSEHYFYVYKYVLSLCRSEAAAEDVTSEAFLKALHSIDGFKGDCEIKVWLCRIARNTYFKTLRNSGKAEPLTPLLRDGGADIEGSLANKSEALMIHRLLHDLSEPYKEVFSLRLFGELSFSDIGKIFAKTESWARVTFHRAKMKIREGLQ